MMNRNPLAQQTLKQKQKLYNSDVKRNAVAYNCTLTKIPLNTLRIENVEFIGGMWRVQKDCDYQIKEIRGKEILLGTRIDHDEKTFFEYYHGAILAYNCYGPIYPTFDLVVARYVTDKGEYWSYGKTIADARAFLGIKLYDEYMDLIHANACKKLNENKVKISKYNKLKKLLFDLLSVNIRGRNHNK